KAAVKGAVVGAAGNLADGAIGAVSAKVDPMIQGGVDKFNQTGVGQTLGGVNANAQGFADRTSAWTNSQREARADKAKGQVWDSKGIVGALNGDKIGNLGVNLDNVGMLKEREEERKAKAEEKRAEREAEAEIESKIEPKVEIQTEQASESKAEPEAGLEAVAAGGLMTEKRTEAGAEPELESKIELETAHNTTRSDRDEYDTKSPNLEALHKKYKALERAQTKYEREKVLPDGRIRYYEKERPAHKPGPTRGNSTVVEYNPKTGSVRLWMESYNHSGEVTRVHPKSINGQELNAPHYPLTKSEIEAKDVR
ncbi:MAG: hypothetical protein FWC40_04450, partial [Proteobacteria bacterium]|nr:hypothetical protein [Pseudomonadota bacterium]